MDDIMMPETCRKDRKGVDRMETVKFWLAGDCEQVLEGTRLVCNRLGACLDEAGVQLRAKKSDCLEVCREAGVLTVKYSILPEFFRGLAIAIHQLRVGEEKAILERRCFDTCGAMLDVSRNMVMTVETVKDFIQLMALMGYNMLMLYTEDTYEMEKYPYFGYMRGAYTKEEIRQIDAYAAIFGLELIPCIQTLSHLTTALRWPYAKPFANTASTLYVGKEETYSFIEDMLLTVKDCFTSRRVHIGMDEAGDISLGKRLKVEGYTSGLELMTEHLQKVCALAEKHGLEPMMWSDMFYKFGHLGGDYDATSRMPEGLAEQIPQNIEMVYWDYCMEDSAVTDLFLQRHARDLGRKTLFAGGIWTWNRLVPNYDKTFTTARSQLRACKNAGVKEVFVTQWSATCGMCDIYAILPGLQIWAEECYHDCVSDAQLASGFEICTGCRLEDFLALGLDEFSQTEKDAYMLEGCFCINSSVQHFYNDILQGLFDKTLSGYDFAGHYSRCLEQLKRLPAMGKYEPVFEKGRVLAEILRIKSTLGPEMTEAYRKEDKQALAGHMRKLEELLGWYKRYHALAYETWHSQYKPFGWEGCDMILGGVEARVNSAIHRLDDYLQGRTEALPELEAERLYYNGIEKPLMETGSLRPIWSAGTAW